VKRVWTFGPFVLNEASSELMRDGKPVPIEPQSLRLLAYLIRHRDRLVSRGDLIDAIWHGRVVSDWAISGAIKVLRRALSGAGTGKQFARTIHSRGFRFDAEVTSSRAPLDTETRPTLLIRIFRIPGEDTGLEYIAEGLAEYLITGLSVKEDWRVLSYNTTRALGDSAPSETLGVTTIVDGSILQLCDTIRINVSALDGHGTRQAWAESHDLTAESLLAGHDMIRDRLIAVLSPGARDIRRNSRGTTSPAAYDQYQKGRYAYFRYEPDAFAEARTHFAKAAEFDPGFAIAYTQQPYCRTSLYVFGLPGADTTLDAAEGLARKAVEINDAAALGHARLGWVLGNTGRPDETIAAFEAACSRDRENAEVHPAYGETMSRLVRPEMAPPPSRGGLFQGQLLPAKLGVPARPFAGPPRRPRAGDRAFPLGPRPVGAIHSCTRATGPRTLGNSGRGRRQTRRGARQGLLPQIRPGTRCAHVSLSGGSGKTPFALRVERSRNELRKACSRADSFLGMRGGISGGHAMRRP
jgi:DNA-binding winged helix-turn-helix (wHTH) protein